MENIESHQVTIVGAGGLFYHCMPSLATVLNSMYPSESEVVVTLVDPDTIEPKNTARQWRYNTADRYKINLAISILRGLCTMNVLPTGVERKINRHNLCHANPDNPEKTNVTICLPDNHLCRAQVHKTLWQLAQEEPPEIQRWGIYAGNSTTDGWCYSCQYTPEGIKWDWGRGHSDIFEEARKELEKLAHPQSCGAESNAAQQTIYGNQLTGVLVAKAFYTVRGWGAGGELYWRMHETGDRVAVWESGLPEEINTTMEYMEGIPSMD